jgi:hypothetical protein
LPRIFLFFQENGYIKRGLFRVLSGIEGDKARRKYWPSNRLSVLQPAGQGALSGPEGPVFGGLADLFRDRALHFLANSRLQSEVVQTAVDLLPEKTEVKGLEVEFLYGEEAFIQGPENETILTPGSCGAGGAADQDGLQQDRFPSGAFEARPFPPFKAHGRSPFMERV